MSMFFPLQVATEKDADGKVTAIPVIASRVNSNLTIQLAHGSHARPAFETMEHHKLDKVTCLVRKVETVPTEKDLGIKYLVSFHSRLKIVSDRLLASMLANFSSL